MTEMHFLVKTALFHEYPGKSPKSAKFPKMSPTNLTPQKVLLFVKKHEISDKTALSLWDWIGVWCPSISPLR